jgi:hypothetical protein
MTGEVALVHGTRASRPVHMSTWIEQETGSITNLVGISSEGYAKISSEAEITEFEIFVFINQQILRLEVAVKNAIQVTIP